MLLALAGALLVIAGLLPACSKKTSSSDEFIRQMNVGKNYLDRGEAQKAMAAFDIAVKLSPTHPDGQLNLANACLLASDRDAALVERALTHAREALALEPNSPAAHYVAGCAQLRLRRFEDALKDLQIARDIDPTVGAVTFQLARAHQELGHLDDAIGLLSELVTFEADHPSAHYVLSQALVRAGRREEGEAALKRHQEIIASKPPAATATISTYERCKYTEARAPFQIEQPQARGIAVTFADVTRDALGDAAASYRGPLGVIDPHQDGKHGLFLREGTAGFRLLLNSNGTFQPHGQTWPLIPEAFYSRCLVGDLQNDRFDDVIMLGDKGSHLFRFATNAQVTDASTFSKLRDLPAIDGALLDLDFTGKLDLLAVSPGGQGIRVLRNLGNLYFNEITTTSGIPATLNAVRQLGVDDWNNDDLLDLFVARSGHPLETLFKVRGGPLSPTNALANLPSADALALGDLNNDLRTDLVIATGNRIELIMNALPDRRQIDLGRDTVSRIRLIDHDNDGWMDLWTAGTRLRVWRNLGQAGFQEVTSALKLDKLSVDRFEDIVFADFDNDGDTDVALATAGQGLRLLRNDGGNANLQVKLKLIGNRSNSSGLGIRLELAAGGLRLVRTANTLPLEIGVGQHRQLDSLTVRWFDLALSSVDVAVEPRTLLPLIELQLPTGSCPYLYAWDGQRYRFVTDILGAAPMGLPAAEGIFIDADVEEYVWVGSEPMFPPKDGHYVLQITEELREVLFLDEAKLVVADHPAGTEVHPTTKLVPRRPFPPSGLVTVDRPIPLRAAQRQDGLDATDLLRVADGQWVSPLQPRIPQLRGLAEPFDVTLDFGTIPADRPLVLVLTGWLRFGGGMANIAASHHPDLPFPFPTLEAETGDGQWHSVDVTLGAPVGKTKTIVTDLTGKLPADCRRLRVRTAFEIHWDRIALFERSTAHTRITHVVPASSDLHWHGFGEFEDLPWQYPLTPIFDRVTHRAPWTINPAGWSTRYGEVNELVLRRDDALVIINAGDGLTLKFAADSLPPLEPGYVRDFFLYSVGWEKDSDFHVTLGWQVEPLPFHGMNDQLYGQQQRPVIDGDWWIKKYNTRWVGPATLKRPTVPPVASR
jgi:Flp pilus assembly protein TadD